MAMTAVALMVVVMTAAAVTASATAAVAAMATAMAVVRQRRQWWQQQWRWGEIQQSTKRGTTERAMAMEMATVIDSDNNDIAADANHSALCYVNTINTPLLKLIVK
jgi:hypothetical protein